MIKKGQNIIIGARLKELRQEKRLKSFEFAQILGISNPQYSRIESGLSAISITQLNRLCEHYNFNQDWIMNGRGNKYFGKETSDFAQKNPLYTETDKDFNQKVKELDVLIRSSLEKSKLSGKDFGFQQTKYQGLKFLLAKREQLIQAKNEIISQIDAIDVLLNATINSEDFVLNELKQFTEVLV